MKTKRSYKDLFFFITKETNQVHMQSGIRSEVHIRQLSKKQDIGFSGSNGKVQWIVIGDGHGTGKVVAEFSKFPWRNLEDITLTVQEILQDFVDSEKISGTNTSWDGTTLSVVRVWMKEGKRIIECSWIGDSSIWVSRLNSEEIGRAHV